jgi:catechol 2,3-dioxygenase-like lactoylglutathione lyase family enzyme
VPQYKEAAATLPVSNLEAARSFYTDTLGLDAVEENAGGIYFQAGSSRVFVYPSEFAGTNQATAAGFDVDDIEAAVEELRGKGVTFQEYDMPGLKTENGIAELEGEKAAWFKDPSGNILSLGQRATPA